MDAPRIQCRSLTKDYTDGPEPVRALDGVDLEIPPGVLWALQGPSGSGKTTLLNILGGLDTPSDGEVLVAGESLSELDDRALSAYRNRRVGFVFQSYNLLPHLSAAENAALPLLIRGAAPPAALKRSTELLDEVGLAEKAPFLPGRLSGGQQQRVALCRALVTEPDILLGDEVTGNLDWESGRAILELVGRACAERGLTALVVTHDPRVLEYAERGLRLVEGRLAG